MAIYRCTGCDHDTNTTFVDMIKDRGPNACTVIRCVGRYVGRGIRNEVERGCAFENADETIRERVERYVAISVHIVAKHEAKMAAVATEAPLSAASPGRGIAS